MGNDTGKDYSQNAHLHGFKEKKHSGKTPVVKNKSSGKKARSGKTGVKRDLKASRRMSLIPDNPKLLFITYDTIERILHFNDSTKMFFNFLLLSKQIKKWINVNASECCQYLVFKILRTITLKKRYVIKRYVVNLEVCISYKDNFEVDFLKQFPCIEVLKIVLNKNILGDGFDCLPKLRKLSVIKCENLTDILFGYLPHQNLESLMISGSKLIAGIGLKKYTSLKELKLMDNYHIKDAIFLKLVNLEVFEVVNCKLLTNKCLHSCKKITQLVLYKNDNFTDVIFSDNLMNMTDLVLELLPKIRGKGISRFVNLRNVRIAKCSSFCSQLPSKIVKLEVIKCDDVKDFVLEKLCQIKDLWIEESVKLKDSVFKNLQTLERLVIIKCDEKLIGEKFRRLTNLKELVVKFNDLIKDFMFKTMTKLEMVEIERCSQIAGRNFTKLKNLKQIRFTECKIVKEETFTQLQENGVVLL